MNSEITLNSIEHYVFCPYQWWLIYVEHEWTENIHTIQGNIVHTKVDDPTFMERRRDLIVERSVPLYSDALGLYGIADLVEYKYKNGELDCVNIVEYKKGSPNDEKKVQLHDGLQLYAQMVCAKEIFKCKVNGYVYYASIRKRAKLDNEEMFNDLLEKTLKEMRELIENNKIPNKNKGKHCNACSLKEVCLPFAGEKNA